MIRKPLWQGFLWLSEHVFDPVIDASPAAATMSLLCGAYVVATFATSDRWWPIGFVGSFWIAGMGLRLTVRALRAEAVLDDLEKKAHAAQMEGLTLTIEPREEESN